MISHAKRRTLGRVATALLSLTFCWPAAAQDYPARQVTILVPFPPGGGTDIGARIVAQKLSERWGKPVIVENKPGAAGNIGLEAASRATPDGYTLLVGNIGTQAINPSLYKSLPYNPDTAFAPIGLIAELPLALVAHPSLPANTLGELFALAKASPGDVTYGSSGAGGMPHLAAAMMESEAGLKLSHVPYKGGGPMMQDVMGGHIKIAFATVLETVGHVRSGKVRAIAVSSAARSVAMPDVQSMSESGLPGFNSSSWIGMLAPSATPKDVVEKIATELRWTLDQADVRDKLSQQGANPSAAEHRSPAGFAKLIGEDRARYAKIIAANGIKAE